MKNLDQPYKPKAWTMAWVCLFFGACAFLMIREAMTNGRGLVLNGIIHLSAHGATIFYWCVAAVSGLFVGVGVPAFFVGLFSSNRLILTGTTISAPKYAFSCTPTVVALSSITCLGVQVVQRQRMLHIRHKGGKLTIMQSWLPSEAVFNEVVATLSATVASGR